MKKKISSLTTEIYYFTATGNSLVVARHIASATGGALISIASASEMARSKESVKIRAKRVGFVFPVYFATNLRSGIPLIVEDFLTKVELTDSHYVFAICTHSGMPGTTIEKVAKIVKSRGGKLAAGFTVKTYNNEPSIKEKLKMSTYGGDSVGTLSEIVQKRREKATDLFNDKLDYLTRYIKERKEGRLESRKQWEKIVFAPVLYLLIRPVFNRRYKKLSNSKGLSFKEMIPLADKSFQHDGNCTGCGTCAKICPVHNITITKNGPEWQQRCENCLACFVWCPNASINGEITKYSTRHHHADVLISDMIKTKQLHFKEVTQS
ncbi:MAG: EFR1 family ferrodoxin [Candidatus Lokiarchaeota archaeon]|nr:EFR1 family ferrodoxin [Candidatus Lokiarchaeota archaeon]